MCKSTSAWCTLLLVFLRFEAPRRRREPSPASLVANGVDFDARPRRHRTSARRQFRARTVVVYYIRAAPSVTLGGTHAAAVKYTAILAFKLAALAAFALKVGPEL